MDSELIQSNVYFNPNTTGSSRAIKVIPTQNTIGLPHLNEVDIMTRFHHPFLLHAKNISTSDHCLYIDVPLGKWTLDNAIQNQLLLPQQWIEVMWKLSCALTFLHQHKILHLDLKSSHIILRGNQEGLRPLIANFTSVQYGDALLMSPLYPNGRWCPPEVLASRRNNEMCQYNQKTDVWLLGMIFLQIMTSSKDNLESTSFDSTSRLETLRRLIPSTYPGGVDLLFRMLDPNPITRLDSTDLLTSGLFITSIEQPIPRGIDKGDNRITLDPRLTSFGLPMSPTSLRGSYVIYSRLEYQHFALVWVCMFIAHKLYDCPTQPSVSLFADRSGLSQEIFLRLELEVVVSTKGNLGYRVGP